VCQARALVGARGKVGEGGRRRKEDGLCDSARANEMDKRVSERVSQPGTPVRGIALSVYYALSELSSEIRNGCQRATTQGE
jgi:hypothetical protein